jgi:DNA-binding NtrC family response regulator
MRAVLFVDQLHLQRALARELGRLGFDVILPVTVDESRQALQSSAYAADLVMLNLRNAQGDTLDLLDAVSQGGTGTAVVLIAEATEIAAARHRVSLNGVVVLPSEVQSFSRSVRQLCGLETRDWFAVRHDDVPPAASTTAGPELRVGMTLSRQRSGTRPPR